MKNLNKLLVLSIFLATIILNSIFVVSAGATITTDKENYEPEEVVLISGSGFMANSPLEVSVTRPDGSVDSCSTSDCDSVFLDGQLTSDSNGAFLDYRYDLDGDEGIYVVEVSDGVNSAQTTFKDGKIVNWVKLNGASSIVVTPGTTINVEINATTYGKKSNRWYYTEYEIEGQGSVCDTTPEPDIDVPGTYVRTFTITAPLSYGEYDASFRIFGTQGCYGSGPSAWYTLMDGIKVVECVEDSDCDYLDNDYCDDNKVMHDEGVCNQDNECEVSTTMVEDCDKGDPCYIDSCEDAECLHTLNDNQGPVVSNPFVDPQLTNEFSDVGAHAEDDCSNITEAYYYVDAYCNNSGVALDAKDGSFDEMIEDLIRYDANLGSKDGRHSLYIMAWDSAGNPSNCAHVYFDLDQVAPNNPRCSSSVYGMELNGICNAQELLVCGDNPILRAEICDDESKLQAAEYFIDDFTKPNWYGIPMDAEDGSFDEQCEFVVAEVDITNLTEGTHYLKLHGKDRAENWGKLSGFDNVSFIKDTTPPSTDKEIEPTNDVIISCYGYEPEEADVSSIGSLTDGCYYVRAGTTIVLSAEDFKPNDLEYAGNVIIHYIVWYKEYPADDWVKDQEGSSGVDEPVYITLDKDSYHLIEYWAEDLCGNEEEHHFELDIVDDKPPVTEKEVGEPKVACEDLGQNDCDYYITQDTPIYLECSDQEPHPVDNVVLYWKDWLEGEDEPEEWNIEEDGSAEIYKDEDSRHILKWYCVDALGNKEEVQTEIDIVETVPPVSTKSVGEPKHPCDEGEWYEYGMPPDGCYYITQNTEINITCSDPEPHPVDMVKIYYRDYFLGEEPPEFTEVDGDMVTIYKNEDSEHVLEWYCVDALGNEEELHREIDIVDTQPPVTVKSVGEPKVEGEDPVDWWITQDTIITLDCSDLEPHPVDHVTLYWRDYKDGEDPGEWNIEEDGYAEIQKQEDCLHVLEWYCEDILGNKEERKVEYDQVDTEPPRIVSKFVVKDGERIYSSEGEIVRIAAKNGDIIKLCAEVEDIKQTEDPGVGVSRVEYRLIGLEDPSEELLWDEGEQAYCKVKVIGTGDLDACGKWHYEVRATDLLGNMGDWTDGIEIIIDNVNPVGEVLNPHAGGWYADGKTFAIYAPAVDFGGDYCSFGCNGQDCPASGVDYCEFYAIDFPFENLDQEEIKDCYQDLWKYFMQIGVNPLVVYLGRVPYENGTCKGYVTIPENSGLTDTVFLGVKYVDKAGNGADNLQLALNPWLSPITMNIDNDAPDIGYISEPPLDPLTKGDSFTLTVEATDNDAGLFSCEAIIIDREGIEHHYPQLPDLDVGRCDITIDIPQDLEDGVVDVMVKIQDSVGNVENESVQVLIDNTPPSLLLTEPQPGATVGGEINIDVSVSDNSGVSLVQYKISEIGMWGICIGGMPGINCYSSKWIDIPEIAPGVYQTSFNSTGLDGKFNFDVRVCDTLRNPNRYALVDDDPHCVLLSEIEADKEKEDEEEP